MNNITAYAVLVIMFLCIPIQGLFADENRKYGLTASPQFGFFYGQAEEIVYPEDTKAKYLSELLWDMKPVFYYGLALDFSRIILTEKIGFFSNLSIKYGIPANSGFMEDRDWQSEENTALTNYSEHDNYTRELLVLDFNAGVSIPFRQRFLLKPFINVSYMRFRFYGVGGYLQYADFLGGGKYGPISQAAVIPLPKDETVINYTQEWLTLAPGLSAGWFFLQKFFTEISLQVSPLIFCADLDEHLLTDKQYRDYMRGGLFLNPGLSFVFELNTIIAFSADFSWRYIVNSKGVTYSKNYGKGYYDFPKGYAGTGLSVINAGLWIKTRF